jgi:hypothetical protein
MGLGGFGLDMRFWAVFEEIILGWLAEGDVLSKKLWECKKCLTLTAYSF